MGLDRPLRRQHTGLSGGVVIDHQVVVRWDPEAITWFGVIGAWQLTCLGQDCTFATAIDRHALAITRAFVHATCCAPEDMKIRWELEAIPRSYVEDDTMRDVRRAVLEERMG